jgi:threonine/homoserine/homoserine lactone efflux protein
MWLAVEAWRARGVFTPGAADDRRNTLALLAQGLLTNLTNPKAVLFFLALFPQFIDPARGPMVAQALILVGLILVPSLLFNLAMCLLAARVRHHLIGDTRFARWTNRLLAAVFGGIALRLVVESR